MNSNVFSGENALRDYLNPDNHPPLPLVELPASLNPHREKGVRIFLKLMHFLPLANVKSLPAYNMLEEAERRGKLASVKALVESSSGNTMLSLAILGRAFGIQRTLALASNQVEPGKLQLLRFLGIDIRIIEENICPDPCDPESGINQAKRMGESAGWLNAGQYDNQANPQAHERWTGPQIWSQTEGKVTLLVAGLGTTGTLCGTGAYLKVQNPKIRALGVIREANNPVPGVRTENLLKQVGFDWQRVADDLIPIGTCPAYEASLTLCRAGIFVGPSSGFAFAGLLAHLSEQSANDLDRMRNEDGEVLAIVIAPDSPFPYIDEYFRYLGSESFPKIENEELLQKRSSEEAPRVFDATDVDLTSEECLKVAYGLSLEELRALCKKGEEAPVTSPFTIIDVRSSRDYKDFHLSRSDPTDYGMLVENFETTFVPMFRRNGLRPIFVCSYGGKSAALALKARSMGIEAWSLKGGILEWSRFGFPRIKNINCDC